MNIVKLATTSSTMAYAEAHFSSCTELRAVSAETQTCGAGRQGRAWMSPPGNVYLTLSFPGSFSHHPAALPTISMVAPLTVLAVLRSRGVDAQVKWPNDIIYQGRKVGGILCVVRRGVVHVGIGLNANSAAFGDLRRLLFPAASLRELTGVTYNVDALVRDLHTSFDDDLRRWRIQGFDRRDEYARHLVRTDLVFRVGPSTHRGSIVDVRDGSVVLDDGTEIFCGDVVQV
jgi:BirA family biotin operon repressor/biotin-[acetyl-CoA-carboxylase] ligase